MEEEFRNEQQGLEERGTESGRRKRQRQKTGSDSVSERTYFLHQKIFHPYYRELYVTFNIS
jgi:hypothetical protein